MRSRTLIVHRASRALPGRCFMTAAVARPPLFRHLVASNPEHESESLAATASSVTLHAALVIAAVALTARVKSAPDVDEPREIVIPTYHIENAPTHPVTGGGASNGLPGPAPIVDFPVPTEVPTVIPPRG